MTRALRRRRLASFVAVLVLVATLPATFPTFHDDGDDPLCSPALVVHDHAAHRIGAASSLTPAPEHCFLCHWLQSQRVPTITTRFVPPAVQSAALTHVDLPSAVATLATNRSGRAPPLA
jgi:hypothetical protein